jgi:hypothetical protein
MLPAADLPLQCVDEVAPRYMLFDSDLPDIARGVCRSAQCPRTACAGVMQVV